MPSGSASRIARATSGGATVAAKSRKPVVVAGRPLVGSVAGDRQEPVVVLLREEREGARPPRTGTDDHHPVAAERARGQAQPAAGVLEVDREALVPRLRIAEVVEPGGHLRRAAGRADDQVRLDRLLEAVSRHADAGHSAAAPHQVEHLAMGDELDIGQRPDAAAYVTFDERPAPQDRP